MRPVKLEDIKRYRRALTGFGGEASLEAALAAAGVPYRRWFSGDGWSFEVDGKVVARGAAIGLLEQDVRRWLRSLPGASHAK